MSPEQQQIAIAKECGWTNIDYYFGRQPIPFTRSFLGGTDDGLAEGEDTLGHEIKPVPDYPNDLNAMHEAQKTLTDGERLIYEYHLADESIKSGNFSHWPLIYASAAERAEAFIKTKDLWI